MQWGKSGQGLAGYDFRSLGADFSACPRVLLVRIFIMSFADNLKSLPEFSGEKLILSDSNGSELAVIANAPGTAGSFRVYAYLADKYGVINVEAAAEGLAIFAEHTEDASRSPGKHPNIDRLIGLMLTADTLHARIA